SYSDGLNRMACGRYSPPSCFPRLSRAESASASRGAGFSTATPDGTASPGSWLYRLPRRSALGFKPRPAVAACEATLFSRRATSSSNSAIRAAKDLASRFPSRLLARSFALLRSSFSSCARNSSLLSFGTVVALRALPVAFAELDAERPGGLRARPVRWAISTDLATRAMVSSPVERWGRQLGDNAALGNPG